MIVSLCDHILFCAPFPNDVYCYVNLSDASRWNGRGTVKVFLVNKVLWSHDAVLKVMDMPAHRHVARSGGIMPRRDVHERLAELLSPGAGAAGLAAS